MDHLQIKIYAYIFCICIPGFCLNPNLVYTLNQCTCFIIKKNKQIKWSIYKDGNKPLSSLPASNESKMTNINNDIYTIVDKSKIKNKLHGYQLSNTKSCYLLQGLSKAIFSRA